jgi:hypothetical protein
MQAQIHTITYSGVELDDINQFIEDGTPLLMTALEPTYVEYLKSSSWNINNIVTSNFTHKHFIIEDNNIYYLGFPEYPWTYRINYLDILTELSFKHWGYTLDSYINLTGNARIMDPSAKHIGDRKFILLQDSAGKPMLLAFNDATFLLTDAVGFHLWDARVDWMQWIETPDSLWKVLLKIGNDIRFVTIPPVNDAYPVIGQPINASDLTRIRLTSVQSIRPFHTRFFYHNDVLCTFISNKAENSFTIGETALWHYDDELERFLLDVTVPASSPFTYYSQYNHAVNIPYENPTFIGDYRWMVITPLSDLFTYFHNNAISYLWKFYRRQFASDGTPFLWNIHEVGDQVYFLFSEDQTNSSPHTTKLVEFIYTEPIVSSLILNVHTGKPLTAVTGYFSVDGDLFVADFRWELISKSEYRVLEGISEVNITEPTLIKLRLTPQLPQTLNAINYVPPPICETPPLLPPLAHPHPELRPDACFYYIIEPVDEATIKFVVPFREFMHFNKSRVSIDTNVPEVAPFILMTVDGETVRHCISNANTICIASRSEFKTFKCNEQCPAYLRRVVEIDIDQASGQDIVGIIEDEREVFPPHNQISYVKMELEY